MFGWRRLFRGWLPNTIFPAGHKYSMLSSKSDNPEIIEDETPDESRDPSRQSEGAGKKKSRNFTLTSLSRETFVAHKLLSTKS